MSEEQACRTCGVIYPATLEFFGVNKRYTNGLQRNCKQCQKQIESNRRTRVRNRAIEEEEAKAKSKGIRVVKFSNTWRPNREGIRNTFSDYTGISSSFSKI